MKKRKPVSVLSTFISCPLCGQRVFPKKSWSYQNPGRWYYADDCRFICWMSGVRAPREPCESQRVQIPIFFFLPLFEFCNAQTLNSLGLTCASFYNSFFTQHKYLNWMAKSWWSSYVQQLKKKLENLPSDWLQVSFPNRSYDAGGVQSALEKYHLKREQELIPILASPFLKNKNNWHPHTNCCRYVKRAEDRSITFYHHSQWLGKVGLAPADVRSIEPDLVPSWRQLFHVCKFIFHMMRSQKKVVAGGKRKKMNDFVRQAPSSKKKMVTEFQSDFDVMKSYINENYYKIPE